MKHVRWCRRRAIFDFWFAGWFHSPKMKARTERMFQRLEKQHEALENNRLAIEENRRARSMMDDMTQ